MAEQRIGASGRLSDVFQEIESAEFASSASVASGYSTFASIVRTSRPVTTLVDLLESDSEVVQATILRVRRLCSLSTDSRYENPLDVAVSAYVLALSIFDREIGAIVATTAVTLTNGWWARMVANKATESPSNNTDVTTLFGDIEDKQNPASAHGSGVDRLLISAGLPIYIAAKPNLRSSTPLPLVEQVS